METKSDGISNLHFQHESVREYASGETIFEEGDTGRDIFVIQSGTVEILKKTALGEITLARFGRGDFFGELGLVHSLPRSARAVARSPARLLVLQPGGFLLKIRRDPTFAFEMIQQLSHRVKISNDRIVELIDKTPITPGELEKIMKEVETRAR
jgi:CRP-like cAMP-binding protein